MENGGYLFAAFAVVWAGVFAYALFLSNKQGKLRQEISLLKAKLEEKGTE
ncbi:MAG: CcmD family protein [Chloroflexi bacterium]|nr:CcmD family protein [Chloroflexota bacterium]